jgi:glycosyltransferase involved in cell wall biosynthesis
MVSLLPRIDSLLERKLADLGIAVMVLSKVFDLTRLKAFTAGAERIVIHAAMPTAGLCGLALARYLRCPMVYSYTNCLHRHRSFKPLSAWNQLKQALEFLIGKHANALHAVSPSIGGQLSTSYPLTKDRIHTVPYVMTQAISDKRRIPSQQLDDYTNAWPRLVCMGRLVSHKRFVDVIRAVAILRPEWPKIKLLILGKGPESKNLKALVAKLDLEESVHFLGPTRAPAAFLEWADLLVHPSLYEGYPRVFAEATALGLPVISVNTPYARDYEQLVGEIITARPYDSSSLAAIIAQTVRQGNRVRSTKRTMPNDRVDVYSLIELYEALLRSSVPEGIVISTPV